MEASTRAVFAAIAAGTWEMNLFELETEVAELELVELIEWCVDGYVLTNDGRYLASRMRAAA